MQLGMCGNFRQKVQLLKYAQTFKKQIFQIQVPEKLLLDRNAAFTASKQQ